MDDDASVGVGSPVVVAVAVELALAPEPAGSATVELGTGVCPDSVEPEVVAEASTVLGSEKQALRPSASMGSVSWRRALEGPNTGRVYRVDESRRKWRTYVGRIVGSAHPLREMQPYSVQVTDGSTSASIRKPDAATGAGGLPISLYA